MGFSTRIRSLYNDQYFRKCIIAWIKVAFIAHVFKEHGYTYEKGAGPSMMPTTEILGDTFLVSKIYRRGRGIEVGDIVSCYSVQEPQTHVMKRVLGLEGDYVLRDSPDSDSDEMVQVPRGHCWVVGDNLPASRDSRLFGPVPMALIRGKVTAKLLPWNERKWFTNSLQPV